MPTNINHQSLVIKGSISTIDALLDKVEAELCKLSSNVQDPMLSNTRSRRNKKLAKS